jgi:hypothetical protein
MTFFLLFLISNYSSLYSRFSDCCLWWRLRALSSQITHSKKIPYHNLFHFCGTRFHHEPTHLSNTKLENFLLQCGRLLLRVPNKITFFQNGRIDRFNFNSQQSYISIYISGPSTRPCNGTNTIHVNRSWHLQDHWPSLHSYELTGLIVTRSQTVITDDYWSDASPYGRVTTIPLQRDTSL